MPLEDHTVTENVAICLLAYFHITAFMICTAKGDKQPNSCSELNTMRRNASYLRATKHRLKITYKNEKVQKSTAYQRIGSLASSLKRLQTQAAWHRSCSSR